MPIARCQIHSVLGLSADCFAGIDLPHPFGTLVYCENRQAQRG